MRPTAAAVLVFCVCGLLAGAGHTARRLAEPAPALPGDLRQLWNRGAGLFAAGRYQEAAAVFASGARQAGALGALRAQAQFLNNLAGACLAGFQYRAAIQAYLEARDLATQQRDWKTVATISANLATAYTLMGELATAHATAEHALELAGKGSSLQPQLLLRVATLRARHKGLSEALPLFAEAARAADRNADARTLAQVWRTLGYEYLHRSDPRAAEPLLLEAFRLDRLYKSPEAFLSFRNLALLRAAQGDLVAGERLLGIALERARASAAGVPLWSLYLHRGRLRRQRGQLAQALADFRQAADSARAWRAEVLPAEAFGVSVDTGLQDLYGALAETAAGLALAGGGHTLAREAFEAAEENRAASLQAELERGPGRAPSFPPGYGELLRELHWLEAAYDRNPAPALRTRLEGIRRQLLDLELKAGLRQAMQAGFRWDRTSHLLERLRQALAPDEAYLGFHLGECAGYRWVVTRERFRMDTLPPRSEIARQVDLFVAALRSGSATTRREGLLVYRLLFDGLDAAVTGKRTWFLGLDSHLFTLPLAALPVPAQSTQLTYLIERHALQVVPGAKSLSQQSAAEWKGGFLGVADPIYNRADPRRHFSARDQTHEGIWRLLPRLSAAADPLELPRLPGSSRETRLCAAVWQGRETRVLEGAEANPEKLAGSLQTRPDVLHLATHILLPTGNPGQASVVLGLGPDGKLQSLGPAAIRGLRPAPRLVVLSGCSSARGLISPGAGLLGLTRAWLTAGARAVVASLWPVPDDSGRLFVRFYTHLQSLRHEGSRAPALALRQAQLDMLAGGDWRAQPRFWSAYAVIGAL